MFKKKDIYSAINARTALFFFNGNLKCCLTLTIRGGGQVEPYDAKFRVKYPCSHHDNTVLIKQIFVTALVMKNT